MSIGRHNYEEYFILYMDDELGAEERQAVEAFVQQYPDLKDELDLLQQYKLVPDQHIVFEGKEELMMPVATEAITLNNYQEWMLLYTDNELSAEQKTTLEQFISTHPSLEKEFSLFKQTYLQPETIVFADKAALYRKEEKERPVVRWWRIAAAAILLLGIGITTAVVINNNKRTGEVAKTTPPVIIKTKEQSPVVIPSKEDKLVKESIVPEKEGKEGPAIIKTPVVPQANNNSMAVQQKNKPVKEKVPVIVPQDIKEEQAVVINKTNNDLPQPLNNPNVTKQSNTNDAIAKNIKDPLTNRTVTTNNSQPSDIVNASYPNDNDAGFDQADSKKNKSRGFFRKIARTFEKRTSVDPTDDNRLLVAGLAIKLK